MDGTILSNQAGIILTSNWEIPDTGANGTFQNTDAGENGYMSVIPNNGRVPGGSSWILVEEKFDASDFGQRWERSVDDELGYFTLKNLKSQSYLTANNSPNTLTIEGMYVSMPHLFFAVRYLFIMCVFLHL